MKTILFLGAIFFALDVLAMDSRGPMTDTHKSISSSTVKTSLLKPARAVSGPKPAPAMEALKPTPSSARRTSLAKVSAVPGTRPAPAMHARKPIPSSAKRTGLPEVRAIPGTKPAPARTPQKTAPGPTVKTSLLTPASSDLEAHPMPTMDELLDGFCQTCKPTCSDFDVHKFDGLFTRHLPIIQTYLKEHTPIESAMELHDIKSHMSSQIREATSLVQKEYDLSQTHLNRAFWVLENRDSHKELIPMFRQVYTLIIQHKPLLMCTATYSFLTNVNKFKGAECLAGYKNRIIVDLLRCITD